jgi:hypothetical protein
MTPAAAISIIISDYDSADPTDADNAALRVKYLRFLQHIYSYVWNIREWEWTYKEATVTITAGNNYVALPTDFQSLGQQGSLYDQNGLQFVPKARYIVERLRRSGGSSTGIFAVWGGKIQLPYAVSATTVLTIFYRLRAETLADGSTEMTIPDRYAHTVIIPGLVFRAQEKKQDARETWSQQFNSGLSQMAAEENPSKFENVRMPLMMRGGW